MIISRGLSPVNASVNRGILYLVVGTTLNSTLVLRSDDTIENSTCIGEYI